MTATTLEPLVRRRCDECGALFNVPLGQMGPLRYCQRCPRDRRTVQQENHARGQSRSLSPFYGASEGRPRRTCAACGRQFYAVSRTERMCSLLCADAEVGRARLD